MGVKLHQVCGGSFQGIELFELKDFLPKDTGWIISNANYIQQNVEIWNGQHKKNFLKGPHTSTTTANSDILTRTKGVVVDDWEFKIARLVQKNISHSYDCVEKEMGIFNEVQFLMSCPQYLTNLLCSVYFLSVLFWKSNLAKASYDKISTFPAENIFNSTLTPDKQK